MKNLKVKLISFLMLTFVMVSCGSDEPIAITPPLNEVLETKDFFIIPSMFDSSLQKKYRNAKKPKNIKNYFESLKPISKLEIKKMLLEIY